MLLANVMIVKNEEHVIERCINAAKAISKHFVIIDTGSTDKTTEILKRLETEGAIITHRDLPWIDFGTNRSQAIDIAREEGYDYALILDADDELKGPLTTPLEADAYSIQVTSGSTTFEQTRLLNLKLPWRYVGKVHEYPTCDEVKTWIHLADLTIHHHNDGGSWKDPEKYKKHALTLWREHLDDPTNPRTVFYLAQSFRDNREYDEAEIWYKKRITMGGFYGEIWFSKYYLGRLELSRGDLAKATRWFLDAYETDTRRAEPLFELLKAYRAIDNPSVAYLFGLEAIQKLIPDGALFPTPSYYGLDLWEEMALCAYTLNNFELAEMLWNKCLELDISNDTRTRILRNKSFIHTK